MKTKIFFVFFLLLLSVIKIAANVTEAQAKEVLQNRFINLTEAKSVYPDLPDTLIIPFSKETLKSNRGGWLIPVRLKDGFEYLLVRANFDNELCMLKKIDTLSVETAKEVLTLIKKLRPGFPGRAESNIQFKYFFRTKDISKNVAISYNGKDFIVIDWPNDVEMGVVSKEYISYLTRNKNGIEIQFETTLLPKNSPKIEEQQSILVLTIFNCRN